MSNPESVLPDRQDLPEEIEKKFDEDVFRQELEPVLKDIIYKLINKFSDKTNITIDADDLPKIIFVPNTRTPWGVRRTQVPTSAGMRCITISEDLMDNKDAVAEEIGHFIRQLLRPEEKHSKNVEEFFGFLGRRILYPSIDRIAPFTSDEEYNKYTDAVKVKIEDINTNKQEKELLERGLNEAEDHYFGYKYASVFDLDRVSDFQKLYSMTDKEVRGRFFTSNQNYSDL